jgi:Skp family chaperone for outer membrane proteins
MNNLNTVGLLALGLLILIKDVVVPLIRKMNGRKNNPINMDRLYQEFKDFKVVQEKWNDKIEKRLEKLENGR